MNRDAHPSSTSTEDVQMIWIFSSGNFAEVEIITDIYDEEDIAYIVRKMEPPGFFAGVGDQGELRVAVEEGRAGDARKFIQQAMVDEAIPGDGNFIDADDKSNQVNVESS